MTKLGGSRSLVDQRVFAQDTAPDDTRDGIMWVDTSDDARPVYVYSAATAAWEPAAPDAVHRADTAPTDATDGDLWIDTSDAQRRVYTYDSANDVWYGRPTAGTNLSRDANGAFNVVQGPGSGLNADFLRGEEPLYIEDSNSPWSTTNGSTISLGDTRDVWLMRIKVSDTSGTGDGWGLQLNGDTSQNYDVTAGNGNVSTGSNQYTDLGYVDANTSQYFEVMLSGRWSGRHRIRARTAGFGAETIAGRNTALASPLTSITPKRTYSANFDIELYGVDIA